MNGNVMESLRNKVLESGITSVYIGDLPALDLECIALRLIDGYGSTRYFGATDLEEPLVEVIIRSKSYETGQVWYAEVKKLLDRFSDSDNGVMSCMLTGSPGYLGRDVNSFNEWHMIFHVTLNSN